MPEYRRFIAYFYEYIDGKKQKNAGFAKVELRNGMWRILFRVVADVTPDGPIQVYGFVRESGYLLGFSLGTLQTGREIAEEWAYRAEALIGHETYRFADLSGIWIQSQDQRYFITVWDDEALDPRKFVLELPEETRQVAAVENEAPAEAAAESVSRAGTGKTLEETKSALHAEESATSQEAITESEFRSESDEKSVRTSRTAISEASCDSCQDNRKLEKNEEKACEQEKRVKESNGQSYPRSAPQPLIEDIFRKRKSFAPFQDDEISSCVQLLPCDVARLQQDSWKIGRSSFLQHGFYQYRHLLLGRRKDGTYVIGVPGIRNPQEKYMAEMFGYDQFKMSRLCECGKKFGYWYRTLNQ